MNRPCPCNGPAVTAGHGMQSRALCGMGSARAAAISHLRRAADLLLREPERANMRSRVVGWLLMSMSTSTAAVSASGHSPARTPPRPECRPLELCALPDPHQQPGVHRCSRVPISVCNRKQGWPDIRRRCLWLYHTNASLQSLAFARCLSRRLLLSCPVPYSQCATMMLSPRRAPVRLTVG